MLEVATSEHNAHQPVLLAECLEHLLTSSDGIYLDGTFGRGGHSAALLQALDDSARLIACDLDPEAIAWGAQAFADEPRLELQNCNFASVRLDLELSGALLDLGLSSPQLDQARRGFSFLRSAPLDMRMNPEQGISAYEWLQQARETEIADVLYYYGEERQSRRIARAIKSHPLENDTVALARLIAAAQPRPDRGKHPATRSFQALRIVVNDELKQLERGLAHIWAHLRVGARLAVISFHSLESRIVKDFARSQSDARLIAKITPSRTEQRSNPRSRSALLRVIQKNPPQPEPKHHLTTDKHR